MVGALIDGESQLLQHNARGAKPDLSVGNLDKCGRREEASEMHLILGGNHMRIPCIDQQMVFACWCFENLGVDLRDENILGLC
eukprot:SAG11_NODE_11299_length_770_cov_0.962742_2_plen_82_part_01